MLVRPKRDKTVISHQATSKTKKSYSGLILKSVAVILIILIAFLYFKSNTSEPRSVSQKQNEIQELKTETIKEKEKTKEKIFTQRPSAQDVRETQELLAKLGYNPGPSDGLYGPKTAKAITSFQADLGLVQDGQFSESILARLRKTIDKRNTVTLPSVQTATSTAENQSPQITDTDPEESEPEPVDYLYLGSPRRDVIRILGLPKNIISTPVDHEIWKYGNSEIHVSKNDKKLIGWNNKEDMKIRLLVKNAATSSMCFTLGSSQDEVIYIQGQPASAITPPGNTYEIWEYENSAVHISKATKKVQGWHNAGNLKVHILPGNNVSTENFYSFSSHQDDVIRLQGTPDSIISNSDFSYDVWEYGSSQVHITKDTKKVENWNNMGDLKVR